MICGNCEAYAVLSYARCTFTPTESVNWKLVSACSPVIDCRSTSVVAEAVPPPCWSTVQVTVTMPADAPVVSRVAVVPAPLIDPADAL